MKTKLLLIFFLLFNNLFGQIKIEDMGDNWKQKIEKSLSLIQETDKDKFDTLLKYCNHITFWNGDFSTTEDSVSIMISQIDMNSNLINNIAAIIIHESFHLKQYKSEMNPDLEEYEAYKYELDFLKRINNCEIWLRIHCIKMMNYHLDRYKEKNFLK